MVPTKPKRPCSYPGCPKLTDGRFCEEHAKAEAKRYEKYDRDRLYAVGMAAPGSAPRPVHPGAPLCELCQRDGRLTPAEGGASQGTSFRGWHTRTGQPRCPL